MKRKGEEKKVLAYRSTNPPMRDPNYKAAKVPYQTVAAAARCQAVPQGGQALPSSAPPWPSPNFLSRSRLRNQNSSLI